LQLSIRASLLFLHPPPSTPSPHSIAHAVTYTQRRPRPCDAAGLRTICHQHHTLVLRVGIINYGDYSLHWDSATSNLDGPNVGPYYQAHSCVLPPCPAPHGKRKKSLSWPSIMLFKLEIEPALALASTAYAGKMPMHSASHEHPLLSIL
jgi:hypothetical protein